MLPATPAPGPAPAATATAAVAVVHGGSPDVIFAFAALLCTVLLAFAC
jgi:hypothetical protein